MPEIVPAGGKGFALSPNALFKTSEAGFRSGAGHEATASDTDDDPAPALCGLENSRDLSFAENGFIRRSCGK